MCLTQNKYYDDISNRSRGDNIQYRVRRSFSLLTENIPSQYLQTCFAHGTDLPQFVRTAAQSLPDYPSQGVGFGRQAVSLPDQPLW